MKSGNSGDINENTARCVSITDIKNECIILYMWLWLYFL